MLTFIEDLALKKFRIWRKSYSVKYEYNRLWRHSSHIDFLCEIFVNIGRLKKNSWHSFYLNFKRIHSTYIFFLYTYIKEVRTLLFLIMYETFVVWNNNYEIEAWTLFTKRIFLLPKNAIIVQSVQSSSFFQVLPA